MATALQRRTVNLPGGLAERVDELARVRFGGSTSAALRAAVEMALIVYGVPDTYRAGDGAEALAVYVKAHGGK